MPRGVTLTVDVYAVMNPIAVTQTDTRRCTGDLCISSPLHDVQCVLADSNNH